MIRSLPLSLTIALAVVGFTAWADPALADWPQWRGPLSNGVSPDADPPIEWSESKNLKWKVKIPGLGSSTPIILGDKVFVTTAVATGKKAPPEVPDPAFKQTGPGAERRW